MTRRCTCDQVAEAPAYHGGQTQQCPRELTEGEYMKQGGLCLPCVFGCFD